jgi:hypothetical protein
MRETQAFYFCLSPSQGDVHDFSSAHSAVSHFFSRSEEELETVNLPIGSLPPSRSPVLHQTVCQSTSMHTTSPPSPSKTTLDEAR